MVDELQLFGSAAAAIVASHAPVSDVVLRTRRFEQASVAAEIQWALLPPLSFMAPEVTIVGALEPAYDIGRDSLDYAINEDVAHLAVFDAMGTSVSSRR